LIFLKPTSPIAFVICIIDAPEPCAALPSLTQFATLFDLPASSSFSDGQAMSLGYHLPGPKKNLGLLGQQSSIPTNEVGPNFVKGTSE
jgi:hypothetical protein